MKKLGSIAIVAMFGILTLASCKKDWTCSCTIHWTNSSLGIDTTLSGSGEIKDVKKSEAKDSCTSQNGVIDDGYGGTFNTDCSLD